MKTLMWTTAVAVMTAAVAVGAQSMQGTDKSMQTPMAKDPGGKMDKTETTYTGCVASFDNDGAFLLIHATEAASSPMSEMKSDMKKDSGMKKDDGMKKADSMTKEATYVLKGSTDFKPHVGEKVSVTGSLSSDTMGTMRKDQIALTVSSLKVVAKSCQ